jgi:hypothetical protein
MGRFFYKPKITLLISKASIAGIPSWCKNLSIDIRFLTKYNSRNLIFKVCFDQIRNLVNLQNYFKSINPNYLNEYKIALENSIGLKIIVITKKNIRQWAYIIKF